MQEKTMKTRRTILNVMGTGAASTLALALIASPAAAQTATSQAATTPTTSTGGVISSSTVGAKKPTATTARMIDEAVQRSQARAAKAVATGTTETFGSEEPFTYKPGATTN
jgi:hypothetical protein